MPIRWPMSLNNCLGCVCVCERGYPLPPLPSVHSLPMTNKAGAIFLVQLTTRQLAGHPLGLRGQGNRGSLLLLHSMLLIKFCCHLPTPSPPPMFLRASCALFHFGCVVGNFFKIVLVTFKLVSEWQQWSFAKMLSFRCCKVFIVALFAPPPPLSTGLFYSAYWPKKGRATEEEREGKGGRAPALFKVSGQELLLAVFHFCPAFALPFIQPFCHHTPYTYLSISLSPCLIPSLYTYTAYLASMKVSVYFRKCNLPLPVARFASFFFVFFIVSAIFNWFCTI